MLNGEVDDLLGGADAIEALRALSGNKRQAVMSARASERIEVQTSVVLRPGNSSQRDQFSHQTVTADISDGGCLLLAPAPAIPGDIYWLEFSDEHVRIGSLLGRCMRSRLVREGVFEAGIKFLIPIDVKATLVASEMDGNSETP